MNYTFEQYGRLIGEIDAQGGHHVQEKMCEAREYSFTGPNPDYKTVLLPGCGNNSIFSIPYEDDVPGTNAAVLDAVELCAVCDDLGHMPRFAHVI